MTALKPGIRCRPARSRCIGRVGSSGWTRFCMVRMTVCRPVPWALNSSFPRDQMKPRMIPVAPDELFKPLQVQRVAADQPVFVQHQHARAGRRLRAVPVWADCARCDRRCSPSPSISRRGNTATHPAAPRPRPRGPVIARAFENVRFAVQQKSLVPVKRHGADAELGFLAVNSN